MTDTDVQLDKNDGSETFVLRVTNVKYANSQSVLTRSILSATGGLAGANPVLSKETWTLTIEIANTDAADYPNSGTYSSTPNTDNYGMYEELRRAANEWGPTTADGLDTMTYDGRTVDVVITDLQLTEDIERDPKREYSGTIELTHFDVYIG